MTDDRPNNPGAETEPGLTAVDRGHRRRPRPLMIATVVALMFVAAACGGGTTDSETAAVGDVVPIQGDSGGEQQGGAENSATDSATPAETGGADETAETGEAGDAAATPSGGGATIADAQEAYREFTDCMRNEGIQMPPAVFDAEGKIDLDAQLAYFQTLDPSDATNEGFADEAAAEEQCLPENAEELLALISPDTSAIEQLQDDLSGELDGQLTALAQCMREEFPDFPDPVGFELDLTEDEAEGSGEFNPFPGIDTDDPLYATRMESCAQSVGLGPING